MNSHQNPQPDQPESDHPELDQALASLFRRLDNGEPVDKEFVKRTYPELADEILAVIGTSLLVNEMAGPTIEEEEASQTRSPDVDLEADTDAFEPGGESNNVGAPDDETKVAAPPTLVAGESQDMAAELVGEIFGDYELLDVIGRGGMGVVYKARQISMDRVVAVKMIQGGRLAAPENVQRFYTEARAGGRTGHPNIVAVYQVGEIDGQHFFSMDYVEGEDLNAQVRRGPMDPRQAAEHLRTIALAIEDAHQHGILHRDLKPANVLIDRDGRPLVTDFGLAKQVEGDEDLTATGVAVGTPSYMAPEQAAGRHDELGPETDVYALGALLFALLTGGPPFRSETAVQTILDVIHREPQAPSSLNDSIDPGLEAICLKCLAKTPEGRYRSAQELADDLDRFLDGRAVEATPMTAWRRRLIWLRDIPLVAAISGRHARPTPAHRRAQWMLLAAIMSAPLLAMAAWYVDHRIAQQMPNPVLIAAGSKGGVYDAFSRGLQPALAENAGVEVEVVESAGSGANRRLLATRGAHLALLQHVDLVPQQVHVIAPLYYEVVHVVVPIESDVRSIEDLAGRRVSLGPRNSGMRAAATAVLKHYQVDVASLRETERSYADLLDGDARLDAAIVTIGLSGDRIREILSSGRCKLIPLVDTANIRHPTLRPFTIEIEHYPAAQLEAPVQTVATPAFLATYPGAPDALVRTTLEQLFERPANIPGRITRDQASAWPGITFHPVAGELFGMTNDLGMPND